MGWEYSAPPAPCSDGRTSVAMPAVPSSVPAQPRALSASPPGSTASISAIMMGMVLTMSDAKPEGTMVSPQVSSMLLPLMKSRPTSASFQPSPRRTRRPRPVSRQSAAITTVETRQRLPETTGTGRDCPATLMAR